MDDETTQDDLEEEEEESEEEEEESDESDTEEEEEDEDESDESEDDEEEDDGEDEDQKGYRKKLNATNRFLQKEGYKFVKGKGWVKGDKPAPKKPSDKPSSKEDAISTTDLYALIEAKVPQQDIEEVAKAAKILGISIPKALKNDTVKAILEKRAKFRTTSRATSTKSRRRGTKPLDGAEIVKEAAKGNIPAAGSPEAEALFWEKRGGKPKQ